jgi:hypothetical protein
MLSSLSGVVNKQTGRAVYPAFFKPNRVHRAESRDCDKNIIALDCPAHDHLLAVARLAITESDNVRFEGQQVVLLAALEVDDAGFL